MTQPQIMFSVKLRVSARLLTTVMQVIEREREIMLESVTPLGPAPESTKLPRYMGGKRNKGITGMELLLKVLAQGPAGGVKRDAIEKVFVAQGFHPTSLSPTISRLLKSRKIKYADGTISLPKPERN